jgi:outer membrane protein
MRKTVFISAAALALLAAPAAAQQGPKFAYVNSQKIIASAPGAKEAQAALDKQRADYSAELQALQDSIQLMIDTYQKQQTTLTATAKSQQEAAIRQRQQEFQDRQQQLQQEFQKKQQDLVKPIMDKIQAVVDQIRKEKSYSMIFDVASPGLISADSTLDITDLVIARLKQTASNPSQR